MGPITPPEVSTEDILRGEKSILLRTKLGPMVGVVVRPMPWRVALAVAEAAEPGERMVRILQACLPKEQSTDTFLDSIIPTYLMVAAGVASRLSMGLPEKKTDASPMPPNRPTEETSPASSSPKAT
jgi:hypothetical protein